MPHTPPFSALISAEFIPDSSLCSHGRKGTDGARDCRPQVRLSEHSKRFSLIQGGGKADIFQGENKAYIPFEKIYLTMCFFQIWEATYCFHIKNHKK